MKGKHRLRAKQYKVSLLNQWKEKAHTYTIKHGSVSISRTCGHRQMHMLLDHSWTL